MFDHAEDQGSAAGVAVAVAVQVRVAQRPAGLADLVEHAVNVDGHQASRPIQRKHQQRVGGVHKVAQDVYGASAFPL